MIQPPYISLYLHISQYISPIGGALDPAALRAHGGEHLVRVRVRVRVGVGVGVRARARPRVRVRVRVRDRARVRVKGRVRVRACAWRGASSP